LGSAHSKTVSDNVENSAGNKQFEEINIEGREEFANSIG
jgi:hypothetical protein